MVTDGVLQLAICHVTPHQLCALIVRILVRMKRDVRRQMLIDLLDYLLRRVTAQVVLVRLNLVQVQYALCQ